MKKNWKNLVIYTVFAVSVFSMTSCGSSPANAPGTENTTEAPKPILVLSIGTKDTMKEYDYIYESANPNSTALTWDARNPDADTLLAIIAELTGWNLTLAQPVSVSPGSLTIAFAKESSSYTGAVDSSKADFAITDRQQLVTTILDSIVANMNRAYNESLTIYFTAADGTDIIIPDSNITIPSAEPYAEAETESTTE